jgi:hypothetical protein
MTKKIVPGTLVSSNSYFLLYEYPEDAVFTFLKCLKSNLQDKFLVHMASLAKKSKSEVAIESDSVSWAIAHAYDEAERRTIANEISYAAYSAATTRATNNADAAAGAAYVEAATTAIASAVAASTNAYALNHKNTCPQTKAAKVLTEIAKISHSCMGKQQKLAKCWLACRQLVCGGGYYFRRA